MCVLKLCKYGKKGLMDFDCVGGGEECTVISDISLSMVLKTCIFADQLTPP